MSPRELVRDMKRKVIEAVLVGPLNKMDLRLHQVMDEFEDEYLKLLEKRLTIDIKGLDEPPMFDERLD